MEKHAANVMIYKPPLGLSDAHFEYSIVDDVVILYDLDKGMSITNDVENVLYDLKAIIPDLKNKHIIYQDTAGIFDEIAVTSDCEFLGFNYLGETSLHQALRVLKASKM